mmetsp:Transcript_23443/g.17905  ORF Transcript_23443/g.17905 Transcript_23443/m.17905 type:complete len:267 (+) Transcript_23443:1038-1838(+)
MAENLVSNSPSKKEEKKGSAAPSGKVVKILMKVLEDFDPKKKEYDEEREMEGILKKDSEKLLTLEDGQQIKFGRDQLNEVVIPLKDGDIDDLQFSLYNRDGVVYMVDQFQHGEATRVKCQLKTKYRINTGDYLSLGLSQDIAVLEAASKNLPPAERLKDLPDGKKFYNHRVVPDGVSEALTSFIKDEDQHKGDPILRFRYLNGYMMNEEVEMEPGSAYTFGRADDQDYQIELDGVSRKHAVVTYNAELGWLIENVSETSGTYIHPK